MDKLKVVIIGAGNIAKQIHLKAYQGMSNIDVVGICDTNEEAARKLGKQYGIAEVYVDYNEMITALSPDIVSICVPNKFHFEIAMAALAKGSHVFCEKPPAITYQQAVEMAATAKQNEKILSYNFMHRFRPEVQYIKEKMQGGELGNVYHIIVTALRRRAIPGWGVFTNADIQGGGALIDIGIHMLDSAMYLLDYPKPVTILAGSHDLIGKQGGIGAFGAWDGDEFQVEDSLFGMIIFENGITMNIQTSFALNNNQRENTNMNLDIYGDKAGVGLSPLQFHKNDAANMIDTTIPVAGDFSMSAINDFVESILKNKDPIVTGENVLPTQLLVEKLYESAKLKKPIVLP